MPGGILQGYQVGNDPVGNGLVTYSWESSSDGSDWQTVGYQKKYKLPLNSIAGHQLRLKSVYIDQENNAESVFSESVSIISPDSVGDQSLVNNGSAQFGIFGVAVANSILQAYQVKNDPDGNGPVNHLWEISSDNQNWRRLGSGSKILLPGNVGEGDLIRLQSIYRDQDGFEELVVSEQISALNPLADITNSGSAQFSLAGVPVVGSQLQIKQDKNDPDGNGVSEFSWLRSFDGITWDQVISGSTYLLGTSDSGTWLRGVAAYKDGYDFRGSSD